MAEQTNLTREYIIPLKREWMKVARYKRARKSTIAVKKFIARHMKVAERDFDKVKLDVYLNNELWARGANKALNKIKVKAIKEGEVVHVHLAETPEVIKYSQAKHKKFHLKGEKKKVEKKEEEIKPDEEHKKDEVEKEKSVEKAKEKIAEQQTKAQKHVTKTSEPKIHRMALKK